MKKYLILITTTLLLLGCDSKPYKPNHTMNTPENAPMKEICIEGVRYLYLGLYGGSNAYGYMSVKFNPNGKVALCDTAIGIEEMKLELQQLRSQVEGK